MNVREKEGMNNQDSAQYFAVRELIHPLKEKV